LNDAPNLKPETSLKPETVLKLETILKNMKRRSFLKTIPLSVPLVTGGSALANIENSLFKNKNLNIMAFELPALPYAANALEPHIDAKTMEIHHGKHHAAYVTNLNNAVTADANAQGKSLEDLCANISKYAPAIRNNGGGHWNHSFFWQILAPNAGGEAKGEIALAINGAFGSFENFKKEFSNAAMTRFGSGWAWLSVDANKNVFISSTPNQDNPLMDVVDKKGTPLLGLDVWEHAYYLNYQNRRADYVTAFFNLVNWDEVNRRFKAAIGG
jgi:superoxide dismutase, Fe-Mn family